MAIISKRLSPIFKVNFSKTIIRTSFLIFFVVFQVFAFREFQRMMALKIWEEAAHLALIDEFKTAKSKYDESEKILKENGPFLFNYGAEAFIAGYSTSESIRILERAKKHYTSTNLYIYLGNNYKILKNYAKAEGCYITAKYMQPSKFLSKFELLLLYKELNLKNKALAEAQEIINFPVKVPSSEVDNYKRYAQDFLESENKK